MGTEKCPFCGQEIDAQATRCFFCGSELDEESVEKRLEQLQRQQGTRSTRKVRSPVTLEVVAAIILICVALFHGSPRTKRSPSFEGPSEGSTVHLNAKVAFAGARLIISNNDSFDWKNVELEIASETAGDYFGLKVPKISAGETHTARAAEFCTKDGTRFNPFTMKLQRFWIRCDTPNEESGSYIAGLK